MYDHTGCITAKVISGSDKDSYSSQTVEWGMQHKHCLKWINFSFCSIFSCFSRVMTVANVRSHWLHLQCSRQKWWLVGWGMQQGKGLGLKWIGFSCAAARNNKQPAPQCGRRLESVLGLNSLLGLFGSVSE